MEFTYDELYRLSTAILSAIYGNNHASAAVCGMDAIMAIREENNRLRELNSKVCAMMEEMDKRSSEPINDDPSVLIRVYGGMVQEVLSNVPGIDCEIFDEDADEYYEENQRDEWQRLTASGQYHGIY